MKNCDFYDKHYYAICVTYPKRTKYIYICIYNFESVIPPESIYSDSGWDTSEPNVRLEESNYTEGQNITNL